MAKNKGNENTIQNISRRKKKFELFPVINGIFFAILCFLIIIPMWKIIVDSLDLKVAYGMRLWPAVFGLDGYTSVFRNVTFYRPLLISILTTVSGTLLSLFITTLAAYVLIQYDMPGRGLFSGFLLFTMIFNGGLIPMYLTLKRLGLYNTLWVVVLPPALNVYNIVLMRNFYEGIPGSLFEAAEIDGASPIQQFIRIALPLSKPALASIGLMAAVQYWNDYTNYKLYITSEKLYNFQMKLRQVVMGSDLPSQAGNATENTVRNAAIIVVILPFAILYPFLQKYFVKGVNIGAVKE